MSRKRKQNGGLLRGPSHERGGMPAIIGGQEPVELEGGEYIIRKSSVNKYGAETMARINQGLVDPNKLRQLQNGGYATPRGGGGNNPIVETNLRAREGQFMYQHNNQPYTGLYHKHQDGTLMIGAGQLGINHEIKPLEVIVSSPSAARTRRNNMGVTRNNRNRNMRGSRRNTTTRRSTPSGRPMGMRRSGYRRGGRVGRRFQQGGHTHPVSNDMTGHRHYQNEQGQPYWESGHRHSIDPNLIGTLVGPANFGTQGLMSGTSVGLDGPGTPSYTSTPINTNMMTGVSGGTHGHGSSTVNPNPMSNRMRNNRMAMNQNNQVMGSYGSEMNRAKRALDGEMAGRAGGYVGQGRIMNRGGKVRSRRMARGGKVGSVPNPRTGKFEHGGAVHNNNMNMCIEGTGQRYTGMTVSAGGVQYSTGGGTLEGGSRRLGPC
jgi:hypothetical protein